MQTNIPAFYSLLYSQLSKRFNRYYDDNGDGKKSEDDKGEDKKDGGDSGKTQAEINQENAFKRIKEERDKFRLEAEEKQKKIDEFEKAQLSEKEKLEKEREEAVKKAEAAERENNRLSAIQENQLPPELAKLIRPGTKEEIAEQMPSILEIKEKLSKSSGSPSPSGSGSRDQKSDETDEEIVALKELEKAAFKSGRAEDAIRFQRQADKLRKDGKIVYKDGKYVATKV